MITTPTALLGFYGYSSRTSELQTFIKDRFRAWVVPLTSHACRVRCVPMRAIYASARLHASPPVLYAACVFLLLPSVTYLCVPGDSTSVAPIHTRFTVRAVACVLYTQALMSSAVMRDASMPGPDDMARHASWACIVDEQVCISNTEMTMLSYVRIARPLHEAVVRSLAASK